MGTTATLRSQSRVRPETLTLAPPNKYPNPNSNSRRRKRSPGTTPKGLPIPDRRDRSQPNPTPNFPAKNLVMGEVKILKRGEPLISATRNSDEKKVGTVADLGSTVRLGPEPETVRIQVRAKELKGYAGTGFFASPPPSELPVPGFLWKKREA